MADEPMNAPPEHDIHNEACGCVPMPGPVTFPAPPARMGDEEFERLVVKMGGEPFCHLPTQFVVAEARRARQREAEKDEEITLFVKKHEELIHGANDLQIALKKAENALAAKDERIERLTKAIADAPHEKRCECFHRGEGGEGACGNCSCWKAAALGREGK